MAITATEARKRLFPLIERVNQDRTTVEITSRRGDAVLMSLAGAWSGRIDERHRLVYLVDGTDVVILQVRYHHG